VASDPKTTRMHDVADVTLPDGADYRIWLTNWRGSPTSPETAPHITFVAESAKPYDIGAMLSLTPQQARDMAAKLIEAAKAVEEGWQ